MSQLANGLIQHSKAQSILFKGCEGLKKSRNIHERVDQVEHVLRLAGYSDENVNAKFISAFYDNCNFMGLSKNDLSIIKPDSKIKFSSEGDQLLQQTSLITGVIQMVTPDAGAPEIRELFPSAQHGAQNLLLDVVDPIVGVTAQKSGLGDQPRRVKTRNITTSIWTGGIQQEYIQFDQQLLMFARQYGNQNISLRGAAYLMALAQEQLWHRYENYMDLQTVYSIVNNQTTYEGEVIPMGIPNSNIIDWADLSGLLGTIDRTSNTITPSDNDVYPMLNIIDTADMIQFRYKKTHKLRWLMNGRTQDLFNQHPNITNYSQYLNANTLALTPASGTVNTFEGIMKYLIPGMEQEVSICNSSYYPDADDPFGNAANANFISGETYPDAIPIMPDGKIICALVPTDKEGPCFEYTFQPVAQNGGLLNAQGGPVMTIVDTLGSNTPEGAFNPSIYMIISANAGLRPKRPFDTFVLNVADVITS